MPGRVEALLLGCMLLALTAGCSAVVNGQDTPSVSPLLFPFFASLRQPLTFFDAQKVLQKEGDHYCGGVLIHKRIVLTAANCQRWKPFLFPKVRIGQHRRQEADPTKFVERRAIAVIVYQDTAGGALGSTNDVALYLLDAAVPDAFKPIALAKNTLPDNTLLTLLGFGDLARGTPNSPATEAARKRPARLQIANKPYWTDARCTARHGARFSGASAICAGFTDATKPDAAFADTGGPLFLAAGALGGGKPAIDTLYGVISGAATPSIYTSAFKLSAWIAINMQKLLSGSEQALQGERVDSLAAQRWRVTDTACRGKTGFVVHTHKLSTDGTARCPDARANLTLVYPDALLTAGGTNKQFSDADFHFEVAGGGLYYVKSNIRSGCTTGVPKPRYLSTPPACNNPALTFTTKPSASKWKVTQSATGATMHAVGAGGACLKYIALPKDATQCAALPLKLVAAPSTTPSFSTKFATRFTLFRDYDPLNPPPPPPSPPSPRPPPPRPPPRPRPPPSPRPPPPRPRPPPPAPPPPMSCLSNSDWTAVKGRLTASNYASFFSASYAFPVAAATWGTYTTNEVAGLVYSSNFSMWGENGSQTQNRTCVWWFFNSKTLSPPPARPLFYGVKAGVSSRATDAWPSMLFLLSDVEPPRFTFGPPNGAAPSWGDFWSDASTRVCAVLTKEMALPNKGKTLDLPCKGADGVAFGSGAKFMIGFAIEPQGTQSVARWGSLNFVRGPA